MPIHLQDLDVTGKLAGHQSTLIIPCYMCPAVTVAVREERPFLQFFSSFLKSPPFEQYIEALQSRLSEKGVVSTVFKSRFLHQWFLCMWTSGRRKQLKRAIGNYDSAIVLGCDSATETVRDLIEAESCTVIQAMEVTGFMNAKMTFHWPCNVSFEDCKVIPLSAQKSERPTR